MIHDITLGLGAGKKYEIRARARLIDQKSGRVGESQFGNLRHACLDNSAANFVDETEIFSKRDELAGVSHFLPGAVRADLCLRSCNDVAAYHYRVHHLTGHPQMFGPILFFQPSTGGSC
jgi:hypothetical protein